MPRTVASRERRKPSASAGRRVWARLRPGRRAIDLALLVGLCLGALTLIPAVLGFERYVITGDSMSGEYDRGSLIYARAVPIGELRVGDVITYEPPRSAGSEGLVTHRIVSIERHRGERVLRTAGDANAAPDPWRFTLSEPTQARVEIGVPYAGYAFAVLGVREVRMALIGLPALAIAIALLVGLWREAGRELEAACGQAATEEG